MSGGKLPGKYVEGGECPETTQSLLHGTRQLSSRREAETSVSRLNLAPVTRTG